MQQHLILSYYVDDSLTSALKNIMSYNCFVILQILSTNPNIAVYSQADF